MRILVIDWYEQTDMINRYEQTYKIDRYERLIW